MGDGLTCPVLAGLASLASERYPLPFGWQRACFIALVLRCRVRRISPIHQYLRRMSQARLPAGSEEQGPLQSRWMKCIDRYQLFSLSLQFGTRRVQV
jgi:hypothetical protein